MSEKKKKRVYRKSADTTIIVRGLGVKTHQGVSRLAAEKGISEAALVKTFLFHKINTYGKH